LQAAGSLFEAGEEEGVKREFRSHRKNREEISFGFRMKLREILRKKRERGKRQ
jgi:hypothetical protein